MVEEAKQEHAANRSEDVESCRFLVVGRGLRRKFIKIKIKISSARVLNARSINNKVDLFKATVYDLQPDIIGVTESWATDIIFDSELHLNIYHIFRCDRNTGNRRRSTAVCKRGP